MLENKDILENQITSLLKEGKEEAISLIYKHYADTLYGLIFKIIPSEEIAQDLLQETFIKIWKNAHKYDATKGRLFTWFSNIARNTAIDKVRSAHFKNEIKNTSIENIANSNHIKSEEVFSRDPGLQKIINSLDEQHRKLIELAYFQGYTQSEIQKELNIPLGTVKTRTRAAIKELRTKLGSDFAKKLLTILLSL